MEEILKNLKKYLQETLDLSVKPVPWKGGAKLSFFLNDSFDFQEALVLGRNCLFVIERPGGSFTPSLVKKHLDKIEKAFSGVCIYVPREITSYNRKRLIDHGVSFIVPGNQMFIPDFGVDLREHFRKAKSAKETFTPAAQALVIYALNSELSQELTPSQAALDLGYALMTMSRAFDELESAGIGRIHRRGKERILRFEEGRKKLWEKARHFLKSPVIKRVRAKGKPPEVAAGLSALSDLTLLASPSIPVFAVSKDWKNQDFEELDDDEDAQFTIEIWNYDPKLFEQRGKVDPFSLYLSLADSEDERVRGALEEMMEALEW